MTQIYYLPDQQLVRPGQDVFTLLDASLEAGIPHTHVCGGNARCSTCRVLICEGLEHCAPRSVAEQDLAERLHFTPEVRLACQTNLRGNGKITLRRLSLDTHDVGNFYDEAIGKVAASFKGQEQQVAIMFADIRGFTTFSEALLPYDVIYVLDRYFQIIGREIQRHGGVINVYMGDGLMALFGVDNPERVVERAVRAAIAMLAAVERLNPSLEAMYQRRLQIGIGINYGHAVIGTIGAPNNPSWTAIGDAVNLASRIESANKLLNTSLLISEAAYREVKDLLSINQSFRVSIPGKSGEYQLFEIAGISSVAETSTVVIQPQPQSRSPGWLERWWRWWRSLWLGR